MHAGSDPEELSRLLGRIHALRREHDRERGVFEIHVISFDAYSPEGIKRLEDLGVSDVIVGFRDTYSNAADSQTLDQKVGALRAYADSVIAKV